jgi:hypothetical protein
MNREWVTLAFGILLVLVVVVVSVMNNMPSRSEETAPTQDEAASTPSEPAAVRPGPPAVLTPSKPPTQAEAVRFDAAVPTVHKHRLGSCEGTLRVSSAGLSYSTTDEDDAFRLPLAEVDQFEFDAERKNLRVRQRGGRTWNFTSRGDDVSGLSAFARQVERARRQTGR